MSLKKCATKAVLSVSHCKAQQEYVFWLYEEFKNICGSPPRPEVSHGYVQYRFASLAHNELRKLRDEIYTPQKTVVSSWLDNVDELGLAVWYMDDGNLKRKSNDQFVFTFATNGFQQQEQFELVKFLLARFGLEAHVSFGLQG